MELTGSLYSLKLLDYVRKYYSNIIILSLFNNNEQKEYSILMFSITASDEAVNKSLKSVIFIFIFRDWKLNNSFSKLTQFSLFMWNSIPKNSENRDRCPYIYTEFTFI